MIKALLLVGGPYHDGPGMRQLVVDAIRAHSQADLTVTDDPAVLVSPQLAQFDVIIAYTTDGTLTDAEGKGLTDFVAGGKGFLGIHGAATSFRSTHSYAAMLGSTFLRHPPLGEVAVTMVDPNHPITQSLAGFSVPDELYVLECDPSQFHLLATGQLGAEAQPSVYTRAWGKGRLVFRQGRFEERVREAYS